eukprot:EG_transcript_15074
MQADDYIWDVLNRTFCSFKIKLKKTDEKFCRNKYNASGMCSYRACPLANSQYATVLEKDGKSYLNIKTIERAHLPKKLWEAIELSKDTKEALAQIEENLQWWPRRMVIRCKVRYLRIKEYLARMRRLAIKPGPKLVNIKKKEERVLDIREEKAHRIAALETSIEKELLKRLREGVYDSQIPLNIPESAFEALIDQQLDEEEEDAGGKGKKASKVQTQEEEEEVEEEQDYYAAADDDDDIDEEDEERVARLLDGLDDYDDLEDEDAEGEPGPAASSKAAKGKKRKHVDVGEAAAKKKATKPVELEVEQERVQPIKQLLDW